MSVGIFFLIYGSKLIRKFHALLNGRRAQKRAMGAAMGDEASAKLGTMTTNIVVAAVFMLLFAVAVPFAFMTEFTFYFAGRWATTFAIFASSIAISFFLARRRREVGGGGGKGVGGSGDSGRN
jgi:hypothetical protein